MKNILLLIGLLWIPQILKSQIEGEVMNEKGEFLYEVLVINLNTKDTIITDVKGKYHLSKARKNHVIRFEKKGYLRQELNVSNQVKVDIILSEDELIIENPIIWPRYSQVGLDYDFINSQLGFKLLNITPHIRKFKPYIITEIEWRKPEEGLRYLQFGLKKYNFLRVGKSSELFLKIGYHQIRNYQAELSEEPQRIERFYLQTELVRHKTKMYIGISSQVINKLIKERNIGVIIGYKLYFPKGISIDPKVELIRKGVQYDIVLRKSMDRLRSIMEIRYERIRSYERIGFGINYSFGY